MAISFPSSPSNGDTYLYNGVTYVYNATTDQWIVESTGSSELYVLKTGDTMTGPFTSAGYSGTTGTFSGRVDVGTKDPTFGYQTELNPSGISWIGSYSANCLAVDPGSGKTKCTVNYVGTPTAGDANDWSFRVAQFDGAFNLVAPRFLVGADGSTYVGGTLPASPNITLNANGHALFGVSAQITTEDIISAGVASGAGRITVRSENLQDSQTSLLQARAKTGARTEYTAELGLFKHSGIADPAAYTSLPSASQGRYYWTATTNNFMCSGTASHIGTGSGTVVGTQSSDIRLKRNIGDFAKGLAEVKQLEAMSFEYLAEPGVAQAGFIAQQVKDIIPEAVYDTGEPVVGDEDGPTKLAMDYSKIIPALVNAIKELDAKNTALEAQLSQLTTTGGASS